LYPGPQYTPATNTVGDLTQPAISLNERDISKAPFPLYKGNGSTAEATYLSGASSGFVVYVNENQEACDDNTIYWER
jgi:hypothetical protein